MNDDLPGDTTVMRLHLWLERGGDTLMGLGRLQLLEQVEACGSLKKAAESLGMSYRAAWGKVKKSEEALGLQLLRNTGGGKSGSTLTEDGQALARTFRAWFTEVEAFALARGQRIFSFPIGSFSETRSTAKASRASGSLPAHPARVAGESARQAVP